MYQLFCELHVKIQVYYYYNTSKLYLRLDFQCALTELTGTSNL